MPELVDRFGRVIEYLRVSVTDRCNYRCFYCMPVTGSRLCRHDDCLSYEELARLIRLFSELGVHKVRLTGGEPLVRRGVVEFARMVGRLPGITDLSLSTNGHLLARFALQLKQAGVRRVNVSLDSLKPDVFSRITHNGDLRQVLRGIDAAVAAGMTPVKLNMVVMNEINDPEIEAMLEFACARGVDLRFIETMPVGAAGNRSMTHYYPAIKILDRVRAKFGTALVPIKAVVGAGPARCYLVSGTHMKVGVISAISRHFCEGCNRVRLTASGDLVLCLGQRDRVGLREALRVGMHDTELKEAIIGAIARKPERHDFLGNCLPLEGSMASLGG